MTFRDLSEDNIRSIFSFCDISTVLSAGMTNKYLYRLSIDKLVWVDLVENLRRRGFVDLLSLSDIRSKSQEELVALVKALLTGPASWNSPILPAPAKPKLSFLARFRSKRTSQGQQTHTRVEISTEYSLRACGRAISIPKLLPGGKYILIINPDTETLECWSVQHEKLIWAYAKTYQDSSVGFSAEVLDGGDEANVVVCEELDLESPKNLVQILNLNFHTGISTTLFANNYPFASFPGPKICGNIVCLDWFHYNHHGSERRYTCILIDWQSMLHLHLADDLWLFHEFPTFAQPIRNHVIVFTNRPSDMPKIHLFNTTAFSRHWRRITDALQSFPVVNISEVQSIISEPFTDNQFLDIWMPELCAYESPLEEGTYRIWVYLAAGHICSYHLSLPNGKRGGIIWRQRSAQFKAAGHLAVGFHSGAPYSGHKIGTVRPQGGSRLFHPAKPSQGVEFALGETACLCNISTYSGALIYREGDALVVAYCK